MLALSNRPWLGYSDQGKFNQVPISCDQLDYAAPFASEQCPEGFVAVSGSTLRVLTIERLGDFFNAQQLKLRYTPRKLAIHPDYNVLVVAESDAATVPYSQRTRTHAIGEEEEEEEVQRLREEVLGAPIGAPGQWGSCLRVVDPAALTTTHCVELDNGEAALSLALVSFDSAPEAGMLVCVGTARNLKFHPRSDEGGVIRVYKLTADGRTLDLVHATPIEEGFPRAMTAYRGRLLVGIGSSLRLYDLGKKRLLRKCEYRGLPWEVSTLDALGPRIYIGDAQESFLFAKYRKAENKFYVFADDSIPRHITSAVALDYDTVTGGDRFGNVFVLRLPQDISAAVEEDPTAGKYATESGRLGSAPNRLQAVANFHVGEAITALQRTTLQLQGREVILYATVNGAIGALYPFTNREDVDFFQHVEIALRQEAPPLLGRDHLAYRSAYSPVRDVIDGDLCQLFARLPAEKAKEVANGLDSTPGEVLKKLETLMNMIV